MAKKKRIDYPEINWVMAAILERKRKLGMSWEDIANHIDFISPGALRQLASKKEPEEWPKAVREKVCDILGVEVRTTVIGCPEDKPNG